MTDKFKGWFFQHLKFTTNQIWDSSGWLFRKRRNMSPGSWILVVDGWRHPETKLEPLEPEPSFGWFFCWKHEEIGPGQTNNKNGAWNVWWVFFCECGVVLFETETKVSLSFSETIVSPVKKQTTLPSTASSERQILRISLQWSLPRPILTKQCCHILQHIFGQVFWHLFS